MSSAVELPGGVYQREIEMMSFNHAVQTPSCAPKKTSGAPSPATVSGPMGFSQCAQQLTFQCKDCATNSDVKTIHPRDLAKRLNSCKESKLLLLDCRPFIAYNLNHIDGALNISCCGQIHEKKSWRGERLRWETSLVVIRMLRTYSKNISKAQTLSFTMKILLISKTYRPITLFPWWFQT